MEDNEIIDKVSGDRSSLFTWNQVAIGVCVDIEEFRSEKILRMGGSERKRIDRRHFGLLGQWGTGCDNLPL